MRELGCQTRPGLVNKQVHGLRTRWHLGFPRRRRTKLSNRGMALYGDGKKGIGKKESGKSNG